MSENVINHKIFCINCGWDLGNNFRINVSNPKGAGLEIYCQQCNTQFVIDALEGDSFANSTDLNIDVAGNQSDNAFKWKNIDENFEPIPYCPFCGPGNGKKENHLEFREKLIGNGSELEEICFCPRCHRNFTVISRSDGTNFGLTD